MQGGFVRLFIAINFPDEVRLKLNRLIRELSDSLPHISWVKDENLHLTLKFLGHTKPEKVAEIEKGIVTSLNGIHPFSLTFIRPGYFSRVPLIIRLGIQKSDTLSSVVDNLEKEMAEIGYRTENRSSFPHVTIGRGRRLKKEEAEKITEKIEAQKQSLNISFEVGEIALMESRLNPHGAIYTALSKFPLN